MSTIGAEDLIFYTDKEGEIHSGGFKVNSILMKQGFSPMMTINQQQKGGQEKQQVSDLFDHLVVPNWTLAFPFKQGGSYKEEKEEDYDDDTDDEVITEDLHTQLLNMVKVDDSNKKKTTRKYRIKKSNKNTKRNKIQI